jgi:hypothetical protein
MILRLTMAIAKPARSPIIHPFPRKPIPTKKPGENYFGFLLDPLTLSEHIPNMLIACSGKWLRLPAAEFSSGKMPLPLEFTKGRHRWRWMRSFH